MCVYHKLCDKFSSISTLMCYILLSQDNILTLYFTCYRQKDWPNRQKQSNSLQVPPQPQVVKWASSLFQRLQAQDFIAACSNFFRPFFDFYCCFPLRFIVDHCFFDHHPLLYLLCHCYFLDLQCLNVEDFYYLILEQEC